MFVLCFSRFLTSQHLLSINFFFVLCNRQLISNYTISAPAFTNKAKINIMLKNPSHKHLKTVQQVCKTTFNCFLIFVAHVLAWASASQNLINFQLECNPNLKENAQGKPKPESHQVSISKTFKDRLASLQNDLQMFPKVCRTCSCRASATENLIHFKSECNPNLKENAQGKPKPESHQFSIRM